MADREQQLAAFVDWTRQHITGDEKGQAQIFLDRLFRAFGQPGSLDVGGSPERRIKKAADEGNSACKAVRTMPGRYRQGICSTENVLFSR